MLYVTIITTVSGQLQPHTRTFLSKIEKKKKGEELILFLLGGISQNVIY